MPVDSQMEISKNRCSLKIHETKKVNFRRAATIGDKLLSDFKASRTYTLYKTCSIYHLQCPCGYFYVGRIKRKLKERITEHKYAICTGNEDDLMAKHYKQHHDCNPDSLKAVSIEMCKSNL